MEFMIDNNFNITVFEKINNTSEVKKIEIATSNQDSVVYTESMDIQIATIQVETAAQETALVEPQEQENIEETIEETGESIPEQDVNAIDSDVDTNDGILEETVGVDEVITEGEIMPEGEIIQEDGMIGGKDMGMGMETGMGETLKDPFLSSWTPIIGISGAVLVVSFGMGILLAKKRIKKGYDLYEDN